MGLVPCSNCGSASYGDARIVGGRIKCRCGCSADIMERMSADQCPNGCGKLRHRRNAILTNGKARYYMCPVCGFERRDTH